MVITRSKGGGNQDSGTGGGPNVELRGDAGMDAS